MAETRILPAIMAGGSGTRLWPLSTERLPKQFQLLTGPLSTYAQTLARVSDKALFLDPLVITADAFADVAARQAAEAGVNATLVLEPMRRDSAAAVATAALLAQDGGKAQLVLVLAADHHVEGDELFRRSIGAGIAAALEGFVVTFGLKPSHAATSYGYIKPGAALTEEAGVFRVEGFAEKPDAVTAEKYVAEGYLWNSGNFLFRADVMVDAFRRHAPDILDGASAAIGDGRRLGHVLHLHPPAFGEIRRISVDHAIMEKTGKLATVTCEFGWSDIGSWDALGEFLPRDNNGNASLGDVLATSARNCIIHSRDRLTVVAGVENLVIINTADAVLVLPRHLSQDVKELAAEVKRLRALQQQKPAIDPGKDS